MNSQTDACPDEDSLRDYAAGRLTGAERDQIEAHLLDCPGCAQRIQSVRLADGDDPQAGLHDRRTMHQDHPSPPPPSAVDPSTEKTQLSDAMMIFSKAESSDEIGRLGIYRILREIGRGGMGVVFEAEDTQLHRRVAIKVLRSDGFDAVSRQRFIQEARIVASLNDPRIVTIYRIGEHDAHPFIVMELLHGESLETYLDRKHHLGTLEAIRIVREVALGLRAAHQKALVHRDIKPGNIWLQSDWESNENGGVKLLDFGIARTVANDNSLTQHGHLIGTPSYMCPERASGMPVDQRSDIFSLGCLFYALLVGESPFERTNTLRSLRAVATVDLESFEEKLVDLRPEVRDYIRRMLARSPGDRPPSTEQVCQDLAELEKLVRQKPLPPWGPLPAIIGRSAAAKQQQLNWMHWVGILVLVISGVVGFWIEVAQIGSSASKPSANRSNPPDSGPSETVAVRSPSASVPVQLEPIRVGILLSRSGPMAPSEGPLLDAFRFAIDEINQAGGLLNGRPLKYFLRDGKSFAAGFEAQAEELIQEDKVCTIFGVWRSSCRIAVERVCERYGNLLVYPVAYEGLESSPNVIYMGGTVNQQVIPSIKWAYAHLGKRKFYLIGTDGLFSRAVHEVIADELKTLGGEIVGNDFHQHGQPDFGNTAAQIRQSAADLIVNTMVGLDNVYFFSAMRRGNIKSSEIPIISYNITEEELQFISSFGYELDGNYSGASYFQSIDTQANAEFKERFLAHFPGRRVTDPVVAAYTGMHLWALAVKGANSDEPQMIRREFPHQQFSGPEGVVSIDPVFQIARRMALIGGVDRNLDFEIEWQTRKAIDPEPFPASRSREAWLKLVQTIRSHHEENWAR